MDDVRQLQASLARLQTALDELTAKLAEQQQQLRATSAVLDSLAAQLGALQRGGDDQSPC
jgi:septal ring factor EnvC (AmiA/AmiB activator)